ncbi:tight adherence pilus pseudopilin TadF [Photobacterium sanguinicancri]|uniref:tight adherence pilus pseudopilin TadF n=1 Tax=Photobacterium sanguinicancri TaxID=875932 RepID=UPI003D0C6C59
MQNKKKQKGVFAIEMAFVLLGMCAVLYFCFDLGYQQIRKSQLERVSYSLVSILKERTIIYKKNKNDKNYETVVQAQVDQLKKIGAVLLKVDESEVSVAVDFRINAQSKPRLSALSTGVSCSPQVLLTNKLDVNLEKSGDPAPIYQVTVCQKVPAWFESVIGSNASKISRILQAQSTFIGR